MRTGISKCLLIVSYSYITFYNFILQRLLFKFDDFLNPGEKLCHYLKFRDSDGLCADEGEAVTVLGLNINVVFRAQTFQYLNVVGQFWKIHYCFNVKTCA